MSSHIDERIASTLVLAVYQFALAETGMSRRFILPGYDETDTDDRDPEEVPDLPPGASLSSLRGAGQDELRATLDALRHDLANHDYDALLARCERLVSNKAEAER